MPTSIVQRVKQAVAPLTRMIGFSAGLPGAALLDPTGRQTTGKMSGAIPLRGEAPSIYQRTGTTVRVRGFEQHPVVSACVRAIVDIASAIPLQNYRIAEEPQDDGAPKESIVPLGRKAPGQILVDSPSSFLSAQRLRAMTSTHFILYGNAFWFLERMPMRDPSAINTNPPIGLRIVHPEDVYTVYVNADGYPLWYLWRDVLGYPHTSPVTDIMHFRDLSGKGIVFGYPRMASALNDIIGDNEASEHVRQVVTNAGAPPAFALVNEETTPQEAEAAEARLYEKWITRGGRGRFAFLGGVKDIKAIGFNLRDLEFPDLRRVAREDICAAAGIDPRMVGIGSASSDGGLSGIQYVEARTRLIQHTIEPMLRSFESELDLWLGPEFGDTFYRYDPDALASLVENHDATSQRVTREVAAGLMTVEEARVALDRPAEFEDDDTLALTLGVQLVPVLIAMNPIATLPASPDGSPDGADPNAAPTVDAQLNGAQIASAKDIVIAVAAGQLPRDAGLAMLKEFYAFDDAEANAVMGTAGTKTPTTPNPISGATPAASPETDKTRRAQLLASVPRSLVVTRSMVLSPEQRALLWQQWDTRATSEEAPYRRAALMQFGEERSIVAGLFAKAQRTDHTGQPVEQSDDATAAALKAVKRQIRALYKPAGEIEQRWQSRFHPIIGQTYANGAEHVMSGLRLTRAGRAVQRRASVPKKGANVAPPSDPSIMYDFHLSDANVQQAIQARAARLAGYVGATTGEAITTALEIGMREGMSIKQLAKLIDRTAFGSGAAYRATMIARTESIGALSAGQFGAAKESGAVQGKEWLTQGDDRVRETHNECEREGVIGIDDKFEATGMLYPGDPEGDAADIISCRCSLLYMDTYDPSERSEPTPARIPAEVVTRVDYVYDDRKQLTGAVVSRGQFHPAPSTLARLNGSPHSEN